MSSWDAIQHISPTASLNAPGVYRIYITPTDGPQFLLSEFIVDNMNGHTGNDSTSTMLANDTATDHSGRGYGWNAVAASNYLAGLGLTHDLWSKYMKDVLIRSYRTEFDMDRTNFETVFGDDTVDASGDIRINRAGSTVVYSDALDEQVYAPLLSGESMTVTDAEAGVGTWTITRDDTGGHTVVLSPANGGADQSLVSDAGMFRWSDSTGTKLRTFDMRSNTILFTGENGATPLTAVATVAENVVDSNAPVTLQTDGSTAASAMVTHRWFYRIAETTTTAANQLIADPSSHTSASPSTDKIYNYTLEVNDKYDRPVFENVLVHVRAASSAISGVQENSNTTLKAVLNSLVDNTLYGVFMTPVDANGDAMGPETFAQYFNYDMSVKVGRAKTKRNDLETRLTVSPADKTNIDGLLQDGNTSKANRIKNMRNYYIDAANADAKARFDNFSRKDKRDLARMTFMEMNEPTLTVEATVFEDFFESYRSVPKKSTHTNEVDVISVETATDTLVLPDLEQKSAYFYGDGDLDFTFKESNAADAALIRYEKTDSVIRLTLTKDGSATVLDNMDEGTTLIWTGDDLETAFPDGSTTVETNGSTHDAFENAFGTGSRCFILGSLVITSVGDDPAISAMFPNLDANDPDVEVDGNGNITVSVDQGDWSENADNSDATALNYYTNLVLPNGYTQNTVTRNLAGGNTYPLSTPGVYTENLVVSYTGTTITSTLPITVNLRPKLSAVTRAIEADETLDLDSLLFDPNTSVTWQFDGATPGTFTLTGSSLVFDSTVAGVVSAVVKAVSGGVESLPVTITVNPPPFEETEYDRTSTPFRVGDASTTVSIARTEVSTAYETFALSGAPPTGFSVSVVGDNIVVAYDGTDPAGNEDENAIDLTLSATDETYATFTTSTTVKIKLFPALPSFATAAHNDDGVPFTQGVASSKQIAVPVYQDVAATGLSYGITADNGMASAFAVALVNGDTQLEITYDGSTAPTAYGNVTITVTATEVGFTQQSTSTTVAVTVQEGAGGGGGGDDNAGAGAGQSTVFTSDVVDFNFIPQKYAEVLTPVIAELNIGIDVDWQQSVQNWCSTLLGDSDPDALAIINTLRHVQPYDQNDDMAFLTEAERASTETDDTAKRALSLTRLNRVRQGMLYQIGKDSEFFGGPTITTSMKDRLQQVVNIVRSQDGLTNPITIDYAKVQQDLGAPTGGLAGLKDVHDGYFGDHQESQTLHNGIPTTEQTGVNAASRLQHLLCGHAFQPVLTSWIHGGNFRRPDGDNTPGALEFDPVGGVHGPEGYISKPAVLKFLARIIVADDGVTKLQDTEQNDPNAENQTTGLTFQLSIDLSFTP